MKNLKIKVKENPTLFVDVHSLIYEISASQDIKINLQMPFFRTRVCFPVAPEWDCLIPQKWPHPNIHKNELPFPWVWCEGVSSLKGAMELAGAAGQALSQEDLLALNNCSDCTAVFHSTLLKLMQREDVQAGLSSGAVSQDCRNLINFFLNRFIAVK